MKSVDKLASKHDVAPCVFHPVQEFQCELHLLLFYHSGSIIEGRFQVCQKVKKRAIFD